MTTSCSRSANARGASGVSAGAVLSDLAREALTGTHRRHSQPGTDRHGFQPLPRRGAAVSNALVDRLREDEPR